MSISQSQQTTSGSTEDINVLVWREVLLREIDDNTLLIKLWCTSPIMQSLIVEKTRRLRFRIYGGTVPCQKYLPSFLPRLVNLNYLKLLLPPSNNRSFEEISTPNVGPICQYMPESVTTLDLREWNYCSIQGDDDLAKLIGNRPQLKLIIHPKEMSRWGSYQRILHYIIDYQVIRNDTLPEALMGCTSIDCGILLKLRAAWNKIDPVVKARLEEGWCQLVDSVNFGSSTPNHQLEEWCYQTFPNITHVTEARTLPLRLTSYTFEHFYISRLHTFEVPSAVFNSPTLTRLEMKLCKIETLPTSFSSSLRHLDIIMDSKLIPDLMVIVGILPCELLSFRLRAVTNYLFNVGHAPIMRGWYNELIAALPRGLQTLKVDDLRVDLENSTLLPPNLTSLIVNGNTIIIDNNMVCQSIPPHLERLHLRLMSQPCINGIPLLISLEEMPPQLPTLIRFQSLVSLRLTILDQSVLARGFSAFPLSLTKLKLQLEYTENSNDNISRLIFPSSLQKLVVSGRGASIDAVQWHPLPDSLVSIKLDGLHIISLPSRWPRSLLYLYLYNHIPDFMYNISGGMINYHPTIGSSYLAYIRNFEDSVVITPRRCIILTKDLDDQTLFVEVDHQTRYVTLELHEY